MLERETRRRTLAPRPPPLRSSATRTRLAHALAQSYLLRPKGARRKKNAGAVSAAELRDRLWTLLVKGHRDVRRAGFWLWADELATHVPPLQSRVLGPRKKKAPAVG